MTRLMYSNQINVEVNVEPKRPRQSVQATTIARIVHPGWTSSIGQIRHRSTHRRAREMCRDASVNYLSLWAMPTLAL